MLIKFSTPIGYDVLAGALFLTLFVDVFDHLLVIFVQDNPLCVKVRGLLRQGRIREAYRIYYSRRVRDLDYLYLHNLVVAGAITLLTAYTKSYVLAIGLVFHLICDIAGMIRHGYPPDIWLYGWQRLFFGK